MSKKARDGFDPDTIISVLKHNSIPTILVEGTGDVEIYRWLEGLMGVGKVDILQCGGRKDLFDIYLRRSEFNGTPVVFLADLDSFLYSSIEIKYRDIIFTTGYSIENDVLANSNIKYLLDDNEKNDYDIALERMMEIYSQKIVRRLYNPSEDLNVHAMSYYDFENSKFLSPNPFTSYAKDPDWYTYINQNPNLTIRGKNLVSIYTSILSRKSRRSKYSRENIIELHLKQSGLPIPIARTIIRIKSKFKLLGIAV